MTPFDVYMIRLTRFLARYGLSPEEIVDWFDDEHGIIVQLQQVKDTLDAIGFVYRPRREWNHIAVDLIARLFRLGVSTRKIVGILNVCGWDANHDQVIRSLKSYESLRMAADPRFVW
ncbi:hypothetical protein MMC07_006710 [Pseudocyphellaria aurata]|nr:hypothetical protein [Pseudocyphellaria aurata]